MSTAECKLAALEVLGDGNTLMSTALCKLAALEDLGVWWDISDGVMRAGMSVAERDLLGGLSGMSAIPPIPMLLTKTEF